MKKILFSTFAVATAGALLSGCATPMAPTRIVTGGTEALTTMGLDMADLMETAQRATRELLTAPALTQFEAKNGRSPRLDVGTIQNKTRERIVIEQVSERIMEVLLDSGMITLVANDAGAKKASALDDFLSDSKLSLQDQADFYLEGSILNQVAAQGGIQERNYTFQLNLNDRGRSQVWKRSLDITKQGGY